MMYASMILVLLMVAAITIDTTEDSSDDPVS